MAFEFKELTKWEKRLLKVIKHEAPKEYDKLLNQAGLLFLRNVALHTPVDTGRLRASLHMQVFKGKKEGVLQKVSKDTIEAGTNVEYAPYVENGYQQRRRWVPGYFKGYRRQVVWSKAGRGGGQIGETKTRSKKFGTYKDASTWAKASVDEPGQVKFRYDPKAETGMMLTGRFIPGKHMFKKGMEDTERQLPELLKDFVRRMGKELDMDVSE